MQAKKNLCLVGAGGSAQSIFQILRLMGRADEVLAFLESDDYYRPRQLYGLPVKPLSYFQVEHHRALLSPGASQGRAQLAEAMPAETQYATLIYPNVLFLDPESTEIGAGSIIYPGCILSGEVRIGRHALILANGVLGHNLSLGDFFTAGVGLNTGGYVQVGPQVQCGMSVSLRDRIRVCEQAQIGMGSVVVRDILEPGIYLGNPARRVK